MDMLRRFLWLAACVTLAVGLIGCSTGGGGAATPTDTQTTDDDQTDTPDGDQTDTPDGDQTQTPDEDTDNLTDLEKKAIVAAGSAPGALAQATDVAEDSTGDLPDDGSSASQQVVPGEISFGTCPEVSKSGSLTASLTDMLDLAEGAVMLTVDFGEEPCTALTMEEEDFTLVCSGSATGTFSLTDQSISLEFDSISCNDQTLDGTVDLSYELLAPGVAFEGMWDLTWYPGAEAIGTEGNGRGSYEPVLSGCCDVTNIAEFTGVITEEGYEWSTSMADILISIEKYYSLIPYSGSVTLDGPDIRAITITFNENSPTTGEVSICIENGRSFTISLYELEEWAEMILTE